MDIHTILWAKRIFKIVPEEINNQDEIAAMIKMSFQEPFWKCFNAVVGSIGQLIQGGLLDEDVIDHYHSQKIFPECALKILKLAITIYNEDKRTKIEMETYGDY